MNPAPMPCQKRFVQARRLPLVSLAQQAGPNQTRSKCANFVTECANFVTEWAFLHKISNDTANGRVFPFVACPLLYPTQAAGHRPLFPTRTTRESPMKMKPRHLHSRTDNLDRRFISERRRFSYAGFIPERRSGKDRRQASSFLYRNEPCPATVGNEKWGGYH